MALNYKSLQASSTIQQTLSLYTCSVTSTIVKSVMIHNDSASSRDVIIKLQKDGSATQLVVFQEKAIAADGSKQALGESIVMQTGDTLYAECSGGDVDITMMYVESTAVLNATSVRELSDWSSDIPSDGDVPVYNATTGEWEPGVGGGGSTTLGGLTDVNTSGATSGDVIVYNGSTWNKSSSLHNLVNILKEPDLNSVSLEKDSNNKIVIDGTSGSENIVATVAGVDVISAKSASIRSDVSVGIGTNPAADLHVYSTGNAEVEVERQAGALINTQAQLTKGVIGTDSNHPLSLKTNSGERLTIDTSGNVGIGTTSPAYPLHVYSNNSTASTGSGITIEQAGTGDTMLEFLLSGVQRWIVGVDNSDDDKFKISEGTDFFGGSRLAILKSSGNVGIGTNYPSVNLELGTDGTAEQQLRLNSDIAGAYLRLESLGNVARMRATNGANLTIQSDGGSGYITNWAGGSERMRINYDGNVGIGTTSPAVTLDVASDNPKIRLTDTDGGIAALEGNLGNLILIADNGNTEASSRIAFKVDGSEHMRIDSSGNVGIGTTTPNYLLDVEGSGAGARVYNTAGSTSVYLTTPAAQNASLYFGPSTDNDEGGITYRTASSSMAFTTNTSEAMRIDSSGNVGIGTTTPSRKFDVNGEAEIKGLYITHANGSNPVDAGSLFFQESGDTWGTDLYGFRINQNGSANTLNFQSANLTTVKDIMTLTRDTANVGIGTTSPSARLDSRVDDGNTHSLRLGRTDTSSFWDFIHAGDDLRIYNTGGSGKDILLGVNSGGVDQGNKVGIGTASPSAKLDVVGFANIEDGSNNVMISSGNTALTTGTDNTAVGDNALESVTSGSYNSAFGAGALTSNSTGVSNSAFGHGALRLNTGANNTAFGTASLRNKTSGDNNSAFGVNALYTNATGSNNIAIGRNAGYYTTGSNNSLVGYYAGFGDATSTFSNTVAVGQQALYRLTTGDHNTAIGLSSSGNITTGGYNVSLGNYALRQNQISGGNTALGYAAAYQTTNGNNTAVGYLSAYYGDQHNASLGARALNYSTGSYNVAVGSYAAYGVSGSSTFSNTVAVGYQALQDLTSGAGNTAVGYQAGLSNTEGNDNTFVGGYAGQANTTGGNNAFVGRNAGYANTSGSVNSFLGVSAGRYNTTGYSNTFLGGLAGNQNTIGYSNSFVGVNAGYSNTSGDNNSFFGRGSGYSNTTGSGNIFIGYEAGYSETGSNKLYISNSNTTTPLIYGDFSLGEITINGKLKPNSITVDDEGLSAAGDYGPGAEIWYEGTSTPSAGFCYYLDSTGGWTAAQANASGTATGMLAVSAGTDSDVDGMVLRGFVQISNTLTGSVGDAVYLETSAAGRFTTTKPTGAGNFVRRVGYLAKGTNVIYFNPSNEYEAL